MDTSLGQLDTVRNAESPSGVVQSGDSGIVYTDGFQKAWSIDAADPHDLQTSGGSTSSAGDTAAAASTGSTSGSGDDAKSSPAGTAQVLNSGSWVLYLTADGHVFVQNLRSGSAASSPFQVQAPAGTTKSGYTVTAATITSNGVVLLYSAKERAVRRYDAASGAFVGGAQAVRQAPASDAKVLLTAAGTSWVLAEPSAHRVWMPSHDGPLRAAFSTGAVAGDGVATGSVAYFADSRGLITVDTESGTVKRAATASGTPAPPTVVGGEVYAAWLGPGGGTLWGSTSSRTRALTVPSGVVERASSLAPMIASNGSTAVLDETSTGLLWTIPSGTLIPRSQWSAQSTPREQQTSEQVVQVPQEEPPVAVPSTFGVRAGAQTLLPVLLNAYDPNKDDVLTIDPGSITALSDPGFGTLSLANDDQGVVFTAHAQSGSATFSYAVTDGREKSAPATVTVNLMPSTQRSAPVWCGVQECRQSWPVASLAPGGSTRVQVLTGWVDPDGDPMVLESAAKVEAKAPITVVPAPDGTVVIQHTDPNAAGASYHVMVTVADARGGVSQKTLDVEVAANPALQVHSFTALAGVGQTRTVDVGPHISGGSGSYRLLSAVATSGQGQVTVDADPSTDSLTLSAGSAGDHTIRVTVQDLQTHAQQTGTMRFSVEAHAQALTIPPQTAFVQSKQDTTLDVLDVVQTMSSRVLSVVSATSNTPSLSVSVVGTRRLRVSGSTGDGQPGEVGVADFTVTDGAGTTAQGQVTVFLSPRSSGVAPIPVPDAVTVRAGAQIDIPVTANDIAPRGEQIELSPSVRGSGAPGELAFASGTTLRYLAPTKAGTYTLHYSVFLASDPERVASSIVTVTVIGSGGDHPPTPPALSASVVSGSTVSIPVPTSGADPDGDTTSLSGVDLLRSGQGTASMNAEGTAIEYTAPAAGVTGGQLQFRYRLRDTQGEDAAGTVTVAVLPAAHADVTPVTYTDTVHAVVGSPKTITAQPLLSDSDPAGGTLRLVSLVPNAPQKSSDGEYARLKALIDPATDLSKGIVKLRAGAVQGVQSYIYTVRSSATTSTAQGLIVVDVTEQAAPETPVVADTVVTLADRLRLATGIDVVSGKVVWPSGDAATMTLNVVGAAASRYTAKGNRISGPLPADGALIPFSLTGTDVFGHKRVAYGFLRIPAFDEMPVALKSGLDPYNVGEEQTTTVDVAKAAGVAKGDRLELKSGSELPVQRANARCEVRDGTRIGYSAGRDAPWSDTCTVQVRVAGQKNWTALAIPFTVRPKAPQAILTSLSRTVPPGQTQTIDLYSDMTGWDGGRVGDQSSLDYTVSSPGSDFIVTQKGRTLTVEARADAHSGAVDTVAVSVSSFGGLSAQISLVVGIAAPDTPRGATFSQTCRVNSGPSCTITVIGQSGQYDPFAGKPGGGLKLAGIGDVNCSVASLSLSGTNAITATWPRSAKPAGGTCQVPYTVVDAQGRQGQGTLALDVQGYPAVPNSITTAAYTAGSVTFLVDLGSAAAAHPSLTGVDIEEDGKPVAAQCAPSVPGAYSCTVSGLTNGQPHSFTARAVNAIGESGDTTPVVAWSYESPVVSSVTATPDTPVTANTGTASISIRSRQSSGVASFLLRDSSGAQTTVQLQGGDTTNYEWQGLPVGTQTITVIPVSRYQPPNGAWGGAATGDAMSATVTIAGAPGFSSDGSLRALSNTSVELDGVQPNANYSAKTLSVIYAVWASGDSTPTCSMDQDGSPTIRGATSQTSTVFTGLDQFTSYRGMACVSNGYQATASNPVSVFTWTSTPGVSGSYTYTVGTTPKTSSTGTSTTLSWNDISGPSPSVPGPPNSRFSTQYTAAATGQTSQSFGDLFSSDRTPGTITVAYCWNGISCGSAATIAPTGAPTTAWVSVQTTPTTTPMVSDLQFSGSVDAPSGDGLTGSSGDVAVTITVDTTTNVVTYSLAFTGAYSAFGTVTLTRPYGS
ncbi:hypothetical protein FPZ11_04440 [Humibacter ginsenosidimutans]|uniref:Fibronectin type-III domain-containing protein n=2 Tax=Humibacter ginsenosidimutans TaxID=2599293 RepID=A0A5B8M1H4_9MICO|nr:hypothetical protein FPZ11_04440 [Humibacter ginsenosidimutans]